MAAVSVLGQRFFDGWTTVLSKSKPSTACRTKNVMSDESEFSRKHDESLRVRYSISFCPIVTLVVSRLARTPGTDHTA